MPRPKKQEDAETTQVTLRIPRETYKKFRMKCIDMDMTGNAAMVKLIEDFLKTEGGK